MKKNLFLLGLLSIVIYGCGAATTPCGTFDFNGTPHSSQGINMTLDFDFDPAECGEPACTCNTIAYVQIVRIIDMENGGFLSPNSQQTNRMVTGHSSAALNGWAVDRLSDRVWGYYGRNNDGTFASTLTPGSNTVDAVLRDIPSGWPDRSWFDAVSVPVCIDSSSSCVNEFAGYYYWLFVVDQNGDTSDPFDKIAVDWHCDAVDESVTEWDNDAPGLGKNTFPAFTRMAACSE